MKRIHAHDDQATRVSLLLGFRFSSPPRVGKRSSLPEDHRWTTQDLIAMMERPEENENSN
jgi:hypothetical protein